MKKRVLSLFSGCGGMDLGIEGDFTVLKRSVGEMLLLKHKVPKTNDKWIKLPRTSFETIFSNDILRAAMAAWTPYFQSKRNSKGEFHLGSIVDLVKKYRNGERGHPPPARPLRADRHEGRGPARRTTGRRPGGRASARGVRARARDFHS